MDRMKDKLKSINIKKAIKASTLLVGLILVVFISFFNATFDFAKFNWYEWLANSSILVGIMIFGILMGNSTGTDIQQEKVSYDEKGNIIGGLYQKSCFEYNNIIVQIEPIKIYFSQFWLWYKNKKLVEKKVDYLIDNQFDIRVAKVIIKNIELEDLQLGKLFYDEGRPSEKIYVKDNVKYKKLNKNQIEIIKKTFTFTLDTFGDSYYLSLFDEGDSKVNEAEKGKKIAEKIARDKRRSFGLKISSSLIISIVWGALTVYDLMSGGDDAVKKAWMNLISRLCALVTSYLSGFSTSVVNVRDKARAIENKTDILKYFKYSYENKLFIPETYEQMIEREYQEQLKHLDNNECEEVIESVEQKE